MSGTAQPPAPMPGLSATPPLHPPADALRRAAGAAFDVSGAYADSPVGFWPLDGASAHLVGGPDREAGQWVLVTCRHSDEPVHAAHLRERSLTAAQRFSLSLWSDGLSAVWVQDGLPDGDAFRIAGVPIGPSDPVGLVWVSDD